MFKANEIDEANSRVVDLEKKVEALSSLLAENDRQRVEYLQNVSHQLVAPLNALKWHVENLTSGRTGVVRAQKALQSIYAQATIAVHLAKNFVFMSNLERDHSLSDLREALEPIRLEALLVHVADDFQPLGWGRKITIEVNDSSFKGMPDVIGMKPLLSQVFSNLVENALKYSAKESHVSIDGAYNETTGKVTITVTNRGIGIAEDEEEVIFERGVRGTEAKNRHPAGTGFGLYIAKKIVELHEGEIEGFTDTNGRTKFSVELDPSASKGKAREWPKKQS